MTDEQPNEPLGNIPRYAIFRGKKARVLSYDDNRFTILAVGDQKFIVGRNQLRFLPEEKKKISK